MSSREGHFQGDRDARGAACATDLVFRFVNRKGDAYFVHEGKTKLGKPRFFASRSPEGALSAVPEGFEVGEDINGVVNVRRPAKVLVTPGDVTLVTERVASYTRLSRYQVRAKGKEILIYQPRGLGAIESVRASKSFSFLDQFEPVIRSLGQKPDEFIEKAIEHTGISAAQFRKQLHQAAEEQKERTIQYLERTLQFEAVLRFTWQEESGVYDVHRGCYRGDEDWLYLGSGRLPALLKKYVAHLGLESFFELM